MKELKRDYFEYTFQITRTSVFEVRYNKVGSNKNAYFATSAGIFNRPKTDFKNCGQCQKEVLKGHQANFFFMKWDKLHLQDLTDAQYQELLVDLESLKKIYNWLDNTRFYNQVTFSKLKLKNIKKVLDKS